MPSHIIAERSSDDTTLTLVLVSAFATAEHVFDRSNLSELIAVVKGNRNINATHPVAPSDVYRELHSHAHFPIYNAASNNPEIPMIRAVPPRPNQRMLAEYLEYVLDRMLAINAPRAMLA